MMSKYKNKIKKCLKSPIASAVHILGFERTAFIPDQVYLKLAYKFYIGEKLNLKNPQTYNEKLQWLKLYNRKPEYTMMVDKVKVRDYIAEKIGGEYLIPLLGIWNSPDEINFNELPNQFVLKCNHNSGTGMCICKDKTRLNYDEVKKNLQRGLRENYYYLGREWPYKNVQRKIIGEQYMVDESGEELRDYKVLCYNGEPRLVELHQGRFTNHQSQDFYDTKWNKTSISQNGTAVYKATNSIYPRPKNLEKMLDLSRTLANDIPHVRVDWYSINGKLYFGELTFFDGSGFDPFDNREDDYMIGSWIDLPVNNEKK